MKLANIKTIMMPLGVIVIVIFVGIAVFNFLLGKINTTLSDTRDQETKNQVLKDRLNTLQEVSNEVRASVNTATLAVPDSNPSVLIVNQLKTIAGSYNIILSNLTINSSGGAQVDLANYDVKFEANAADYQSLFSFVENLSRITPLVNLASIKVASLLGEVKAEMTLVGFSASFPESLPALDAPISGLTADEEAVINTLSSFSHPIISGPVAPLDESAPREDPFSLSL